MEKDYQKNIVNNFEPGCNCHVYNAPISGYVFAMPGATVNQQVPEKTKTKTKTKKEEDIETEMMEKLQTDLSWQRLCESGLIDDDGQPTVSRPEAALIANILAERLDIANKWKFFEQLWHRNNMRGDYNTALDQRKSLKFQEKLKIIFG